MKPETEATLRRFAKSSNAFAFDLYARRRGDAGDLTFSPASVTTALAMAWAGARGETAEEMRRALHVEGGQADGAAAAGALVARMNLPSSGPTLRVQNRIFGERSMRFEPPFVELTRAAFGAPLEPLDFAGASAQARGRINGWAEEATEGRITELVPRDGVGPDTRLVLVNAIYFLGLWQSPFHERLTKPEPFFAGGGAPKPVPTMHQIGTFGYAAGGGVKALELPYEGGKLALTILLPDGRDGLASLEASLSAERFDAWAGSLKPERVEVRLPTFKIEPAQSLSLGEDLAALGMRRAFSEREADFGGIASPPDPADRIFLGAVFHKAFVRVDEKGTEAAAATAASMPRGGPPPARPVEFRADHPFLFVLRDRATGLILFVGRVADPKPA
jgi:serpin B